MFWLYRRLLCFRFWGETSVVSNVVRNMTVSYTLEVANARFAGFTKLLFRWRGSIYKLLYKEFLVFCSAFATFSIIYRYYKPSHSIKLYINSLHASVVCCIVCVCVLDAYSLKIRRICLNESRVTATNLLN